MRIFTRIWCDIKIDAAIIIIVIYSFYLCFKRFIGCDVEYVMFNTMLVIYM